MIVQMKKAAIIILSQDNERAVKELRKLGVLHIEHAKPPVSKDITLLKEELSLITQAVAVMTQDEFCPAGAKFENKEPQDWRHLVSHIIDCRKRIEQLQDYSRNLKLQIALWEHWGDFAPQEIVSLKEKGIYIKLYYIPKKDLKDLAQDLCVNIIFTQGGIAHCAITSCRDFILPFKELSLPRMSLGLMRKRLVDEQKVLAALKQDIRQSNCYYRAIAGIKKAVEKDIEYQEVLKGMGEAGELSYLTGYVPFDKVDLLFKLAKNEKWAISVDEPLDEDNVPTLIRNPRWISLIQPVFQLMEVVPGYREFDISLWFLLFFCVFFGIIIGDAGYGLVYLTLTFLAQRRFSHKVKNNSVFFLFYVLSLCAIFWGVLSANFFGQEWLKGLVKPLAPALTNDVKVRKFCFFLGALHLSIAHIWRIIAQFPALVFLAEAGWLCILWSAFFIANLLILAEPLPHYLAGLITTGISLVILFSSPRRNIFRGLSAGLGTLLLNLMNNFTDIVSYIRLFAVGLASIAIADAFNTMAAAVGFKGVLTGLLSSLILIIGHSLNIILGPMSVLVHGVRLNVLEFCTHLDVKWKGFLYRPLQEGSG
jgi:V/A-type H+-transporting ATPase subunit I